jgi:hypothetical protein
MSCPRSTTSTVRRHLFTAMGCRVVAGGVGGVGVVRRMGDIQAGLATLDQAFEFAEATNERFFEAELIVCAVPCSRRWAREARQRRRCGGR